MTATKLIGLTTVVAGLVFVGPARAQGLNQCIDSCIDTCAEQCPASASDVAAKPTKTTRRTTVKAKPRVTPVAPLDANAIRAEERARAAEEFRAANLETAAEREAVLARVREEERELAKSSIASARAEAEKEANEKYRSELMRRDQEIAKRDHELVRSGQQLELTRSELGKEQDEPVIKKALVTPVGLYGFLGGGAADFTQPNASGTASLGGYWDARLGIGTRSIFGAEVAYVGGARDVQALGLNEGAFLVNNGVEGVARLNVPITTEEVLFEPYTFGGVGWQHYSLANDTTNTSSVDADDDIMTVPMGVGMAVGYNGVTLDLRGTYRHAIFSDLVGESDSSFDEQSLNSWGAGLALGFEF